MYASAPAQAALPDGVTESSFVAANGERVLELSCEVPAGAARVWDAWTSAEGFTAWAAPFAHVDFRVGGAIESSYDPKAKPGDPGNIRNEFLALVPERLAAFAALLERHPRARHDPAVAQTLDGQLQPLRDMQIQAATAHNRPCVGFLLHCYTDPKSDSLYALRRRKQQPDGR